MKFKWSLADNPQQYKGAIIQLEQIIIILLDNALKYTTHGSIGLQLEFKNQKLICRITDTGNGIPKKQRQLVFEKFYRLVHKQKKQISKEGLGLGLYIAKKILEKINGNISISDNPEGQGSLFIVEIPVF